MDFFELVKTGTSQSVQAAISKGADVNAHDNIGWTALMAAAARNPNPEVITTLLKAGADIKARDTDGSTPLMYAARFNQNSEVITTLLNAGADVKAKDSTGKTAFDYSKDNETLEGSDAYSKLASSYAPTTDFFELVKTGMPQDVQAAIRNGADVNAWFFNGRTPLMCAAGFNKNPEVTTVLLKAGADPKAKDIFGKTAFDYAQNNTKLKGTNAYNALEQASK